MMSTATAWQLPTKQQTLLDSAIVVFAAKGYRQAAVADILREAGAARGTFYHYYKSKRAIFLHALAYYEALVGESDARIASGADSERDLASRARQEILARLRFYDKHRDLAMLVFRVARAPDEDFRREAESLLFRWRARVRARYAAWLQAGHMRRADLDLVAAFSIGLWTEVVIQEVCQRNRYSLEEIAEELFRFEQLALGAHQTRGE